MSLELIHAFGIATLQGPPDETHRKFGVPVGGAFDREAYRILTALIGLPEGSPVWELGMANARFRALTGGMLGVVGAQCAVSVDGHGARSQAAFPVRPGSEIHIGPPEHGARVYVALQPGELGRPRRLTDLPPHTPTAIRVVAGPQSSFFDLDKVVGSRFLVDTASDRVGVRLNGNLPGHDIELPSEPACVGAIQVTRSGQLLALGPDGPTIGGYPKIAVVVDADLDRLAQLRPGNGVTFRLVSQDEAREARATRLERLNRACLSLRVGTGNLQIRPLDAG